MEINITTQPGLRINCADRVKTARQKASGLSRSDWNGRMPLQFSQRLNCNNGFVRVQIRGW